VSPRHKDAVEAARKASDDAQVARSGGS
jgi:hypothetical protein